MDQWRQALSWQGSELAIVCISGRLPSHMILGVQNVWRLISASFIFLHSVARVLDICEPSKLALAVQQQNSGLVCVWIIHTLSWIPPARYPQPQLRFVLAYRSSITAPPLEGRAAGSNQCVTADWKVRSSSSHLEYRALLGSSATAGADSGQDGEVLLIWRTDRPPELIYRHLLSNGTVAWSCTSTAQCIFTSCCLIKQRDNFAHEELRHLGYNAMKRIESQPFLRRNIPTHLQGRRLSSSKKPAWKEVAERHGGYTKCPLETLVDSQQTSPLDVPENRITAVTDANVQLMSLQLTNF
jgi:hypothetical protein